MSNQEIQNIFGFGTNLSVPIGSILMFYSNTIPYDYLLCDGQNISATLYPQLFQLIGSATPDLRDAFIRGRAGARVIGDVQQESFGSHTHQVQGDSAQASVPHRHNSDFVPFATSGQLQQFYNADLDGGDIGNGLFKTIGNNPAIDKQNGLGYTEYALDTLHTHFINLTTTASGNGTEVRPRNICVNYIIKAR